MRELGGANAILTGASRGLGVHIAKALAGKGVNLALVARSASLLEEVRTEVVALGVKAAAIPADVTVSSHRLLNGKAAKSSRYRTYVRVLPTGSRRLASTNFCIPVAGVFQ